MGRPPDDLCDERDTMFQRFFGGLMAPFERRHGKHARVDFDVTENDKEITARAIPGFDDKDLDMQVERQSPDHKSREEGRDQGVTRLPQLTANCDLAAWHRPEQSPGDLQERRTRTLHSQAGRKLDETHLGEDELTKGRPNIN